jgi:hypothetical protein
VGGSEYRASSSVRRSVLDNMFAGPCMVQWTSATCGDFTAEENLSRRN